MYLKHWQQWAYYSQWVIATGATAQCFETVLRFGLQGVNPWFYVLIFSVTLLQYMLHFRFYRTGKALNQRQVFFSIHRNYLLVQFATAGFFFAAGFFYAGRSLLIPLSIMGLFTFAYSFFLLTSPRSGIFRYNGLFKIATITVIWSAVTGVLPIFAAGQDIREPKFIFHCCMRLLMMLAICLPFDVRDIDSDRRKGTITIPAIIGAANSFTACYISLLLNIVLVFISVYADWNTIPVAVTNAFANAFLMFCIWYSSKHLKDEFSWFLLDANLLLHTLIILPVIFLQQ